MKAVASVVPPSATALQKQLDCGYFSRIVPPTENSEKPLMLIIAVQLVLGCRAGFFDVLVAIPIVATVMVPVQELYVRDVLKKPHEQVMESAGAGYKIDAIAHFPPILEADLS